MSKKHSRNSCNPKRPKPSSAFPIGSQQVCPPLLDSLRSPESKRGYLHAINESFDGTVPNRDCPSTRLWSHLTVSSSEPSACCGHNQSTTPRSTSTRL